MNKILFAAITATLLWSCGGNNGDDAGMREGKGGKFYGGVLRTNEIEDFRSLYPLGVNEIASIHIASNMYEGLVKLTQSADLTPVPCLAEKIEKTDDAKTWTFYIRKGVKFHDDACFADGKGRDLNANDIKYCFDRLCTASSDNQQYGITFKGKVEGADEYFKSTIDKNPIAGGVSGIKIIDDYTVQISLKYSFAGFLNILAMPGCWIYPKEAVEKYGTDMRAHCVGTGPFIIKSLKEGDAVIMERNKNYWGVDKDGNQLPYLDGVKYTFIKEKKSELFEFKKGNLDMIFRLPNEFIADILDEFNHAKDGNNKFSMQIVPAMSINYYGFQHQSEIFNKKDVRLAFNYAVDRDKLVTFTLQGDGIPANYGIVPPSFKDYNHKDIKGYKFNPDTAKLLLAKAGYPDGKNFPKLTLQINSGGQRNVQVAEVIQKMLKENLNIDINIDLMPMAEHMESFETGKAMFWRTAWIADYPDPESFLTILYGKLAPAVLTERSSVNAVRYKSERFDSLFEAALKEVDLRKRYDLYQMADQQAINDGAVMPLFYDENYRLLQLWVRNFDANAMEYRDLTEVYFVPKDQVKKAE